MVSFSNKEFLKLVWEYGSPVVTLLALLGLGRGFGGSCFQWGFVLSSSHKVAEQLGLLQEEVEPGEHFCNLCTWSTILR